MSYVFPPVQIVANTPLPLLIIHVHVIQQCLIKQTGRRTIQNSNLCFMGNHLPVIQFDKTAEVVDKVHVRHTNTEDRRLTSISSEHYQVEVHQKDKSWTLHPGVQESYDSVRSLSVHVVKIGPQCVHVWLTKLSCLIGINFADNF